MAYVFVEDFKYGMDRRRPRFAGVPGTLWLGENVHLTRGGDVERAKKFVPLYDVTGTFGLAELDGRVYVFGSADLAASMPLGVTYTRLQAPDTPAMTDVLCVRKFDGKLYVVAAYADGNRYHFYDGSRVSDLDTVVAGMASKSLTYKVLATGISADPAVTAQPTSNGVVLTAVAPGTAFTPSATTDNVSGTTITELQANVAAVAAVPAEADIEVTAGTFDPGLNRITSVKAGAVELLSGPVDFISSLGATANALAVAINDGTAVHGYTASAVGETVTLDAPGGAGGNGTTLSVTTSGDVTVSAEATFADGVDAVDPVAQVSRIVFDGTWAAADTLTVTVDGRDYVLTGLGAATPERVHVQHSRMWALTASALRYCKLNDPTDWTDATETTGAGVIAVSTDSDGAQNLIGIEAYQGQTAIFAEQNIVIYQFGTDPDTFEMVQDLPNSGTISGGSVKGYGANDVFYLATTGVRSLQARDSSNAAFVSDAGTTFDPYVKEVIAAVTLGEVRGAEALLEPEDGRYWLAIGDKILVLTNFPGTGIRGWTYYAPGFTVTAAARTSRRTFVRDADTIYVYGGLSGTEYPAAGELACSVSLPYMSARDDAGFKFLAGLDIGSVNEWDVTALINPNDPADTVAIGKLTDVTYSNDNADAIGESTHMAFDFVCDRGGYALLANMAVHHEGKLRA